MNTYFKIALALVTISFFAFTATTDKEKSNSITAVIDVSHGGNDTGVQHNHLLEKELVQQIALKMAELNNDTSVKLHFTRTGDETIPLHHRVGFINSIEPDVVLSLHIEDKPLDASGVSVYYSDKGNHTKKAQQLASKVLQAFKKSGDIVSSEARLAPFYILRKSEAPAVVIELGNLANQNDYQLLQDDEEQTKIAKTLLSAIKHN